MTKPQSLFWRQTRNVVELEQSHHNGCRLKKISANLMNREVRAPGQFSVCDLILQGVISESDVSAEGHVSEDVRLEGERALLELGISQSSQLYRRRPLRPRRAPRPRIASRPRSAPHAIPHTVSHAMTQAASSSERTHQQTSEHSELTCTICYSNARSHIFLPCFHFHACESCSKRLENCPVCREPIMCVHQVWY